MQRRFLEECLADGMSLEAIGETVGKHPSTVSYWLKKHGLKAAGQARHAPKGNVDVDRLQALLDEGKSIRHIADELGAGYSTVRYWIGRLGLESDRMARRREGEVARKAGLRRTYLRCPRHGHTSFFARPEGGFRCAKCNTAAVSERRRASSGCWSRRLAGSAWLAALPGTQQHCSFTIAILPKRNSILASKAIAEALAGCVPRRRSVSCCAPTAMH